MLYKEIIAVYCEIHTKHINTLCPQNVEMLSVKLAVHIVTTGLQKVRLKQCATHHSSHGHHIVITDGRKLSYKNGRRPLEDLSELVKKKSVS